MWKCYKKLRKNGSVKLLKIEQIIKTTWRVLNTVFRALEQLDPDDEGEGDSTRMSNMVVYVVNNTTTKLRHAVSVRAAIVVKNTTNFEHKYY